MTRLSLTIITLANWSGLLESDSGAPKIVLATAGRLGTERACIDLATACTPTMRRIIGVARLVELCMDGG